MRVGLTDARGYTFTRPAESSRVAGAVAEGSMPPPPLDLSAGRGKPR
jgi:hypothetical protein